MSSMKSSARLFIGIILLLSSLGLGAPQGRNARVEEARKLAERVIERGENTFIALSDDLWRNAELPFEEYKTMEIITGTLEQAGFTVEKGLAQMPTAFMATYGTGGPVIGLMAEMDGVPGMSQDTVSHPETVTERPISHGCQHNLVSASSVATALALKEVIDSLKIPATVKVFGPPAEEVLIGKVYMAREGLFDGVDVVLSWHSDRTTNARYNASLFIDTVRVRFHRKGSEHPLRYFKNFESNIEFLRELLPEDQRVTEPAIVKAGGRPGLPLETVEAWYSLRTFDRESVDSLFESFQNITEFMREVMGAPVEVELINGVYPRLPIVSLVNILDRNLRLYWPPSFTAEEKEFASNLQEEYSREHPGFQASAPLHDGVLEPPIQAPKPAGNDNGDVSWVVPFAAISGGSRAMGLPTHNWQSTAAGGMSIGHKVMIMMSKALAAAAIDMMVDPSELERVREEFEEKTRGFVYKPYVPDRPPMDFYRELNRILRSN